MHAFCRNDCEWRKWMCVWWIRAASSEAYRALTYIEVSAKLTLRQALGRASQYIAA
jgi:hypothetical protein